jgi:hypothetical protein
MNKDKRSPNKLLKRFVYLVAIIFAVFLTAIISIYGYGELNFRYSEKVFEQLDQSLQINSAGLLRDDVWSMLDNEAYKRLNCYSYDTTSGLHYIVCKSPSFVEYYNYNNIIPDIGNYLLSWASYRISFEFDGEHFQSYLISKHYNWTI